MKKAFNCLFLLTVLFGASLFAQIKDWGSFWGEQNEHRMMDTTALSSLQTDSQSDNFTRVNAGVV